MLLCSNTDTANDIDELSEVAPQSPVIVGKIVGQHGVTGWVKVFSYTRPVEQILQYARWVISAQQNFTEQQAVQVVSTKQHSNKLFVKLAGIDDRDAAQRLAHNWIAIDPSLLAQLPQGEYYWNDLLGLTVINQDGVELGVVDHLVETGANDVLVVHQSKVADDVATDKVANEIIERLVPWSPNVIIDVDVVNRCIRVDWHPQD